MDNNSSASGREKSPSKWLIALLIIAVLATAWTALQEKKAEDDGVDDLVLSRSSGVANQSVVAKQGESKINQPLSSKQAEMLMNHATSIPWEKLKREPMGEKAYDLFKVHSWEVTIPPEQSEAMLNPVPEVPPVPFSYLGKFEDLVFLMGKDQLYSVNKGEKIDLQWRLDSEEADTLHLTYLPLNLPQVMSKTEAQVLPTPTDPVPAAAVETNQ